MVQKLDFGFNKKDLLKDILQNFKETDFAVTDLSHSRAIIEIEDKI